MLRRAFSCPLSLLFIVTALFTFLIQSGELGTSDTTHRLQVTHSLWTDQPQVFPEEFPEFGVHGRGGRLYASYGIGQSLLMLPADLASTALSRLPLWRNYVETQADPTIRNILVSVSTNLLINVLTALAAFHLLGLLGFSVRQSVAGTLGLLCATTHLHYAQNMTENNYILLLTITGFVLHYRWLKTGNRWSLFWGSAALGLNLLTRITTILDIACAACFLLLVIFFSRRQRHSHADTMPSKRETGPLGASFLSTQRTFLSTALPVYAFFFLLDRIYQYIRFGSWTNTYVAILAKEQIKMNPALPSNFPFDGHWFRGGLDSGMLGPFFAPEKSVFLFDPMFPLTLVVILLLWKRLTPSVRAFSIAALLLFVAYTAFYAGYDSWGGDFAWGDRYLSSAVELVTLIAIPLLLRYRTAMRPSAWRAALMVIGTSLVVQCASLAFWLPLELYQMETFGRHTWVVWLRLKNIAAFALGRSAAWGLNTPAVYQDPWDAAHLTTWNFLPSLLRHMGVAPLGAVWTLYGVWLAVALALLAASARLFHVLLLPSVPAVPQD